MIRNSLSTNMMSNNVRGRREFNTQQQSSLLHRRRDLFEYTRPELNQSFGKSRAVTASRAKPIYKLIRPKGAEIQMESKKKSQDFKRRDTLMIRNEMFPEETPEQRLRRLGIMQEDVKTNQAIRIARTKTIRMGRMLTKTEAKI